MLYREIIAVCSEIHTKHIHTAVCGQNVEFMNVKLAVHIVTTGLETVIETVTTKYLKYSIISQCIAVSANRCLAGVLYHANEDTKFSPNPCQSTQCFKPRHQTASSVFKFIYCCPCHA